MEDNLRFKCKTMLSSVTVTKQLRAVMLPLLPFESEQHCSNCYLQGQSSQAPLLELELENMLGLSASLLVKLRNLPQVRASMALLDPLQWVRDAMALPLPAA